MTEETTILEVELTIKEARALVRSAGFMSAAFGGFGEFDELTTTDLEQGQMKLEVALAIARADR